jgi:hypothetical protein
LSLIHFVVPPKFPAWEILNRATVVV